MIDLVIGIRTRGCMKVNADGSTELWSSPHHLRFHGSCYLLYLMHLIHAVYKVHNSSSYICCLNDSIMSMSSSNEAKWTNQNCFILVARFMSLRAEKMSKNSLEREIFFSGRLCISNYFDDLVLDSCCCCYKNMLKTSTPLSLQVT